MRITKKEIKDYLKEVKEAIKKDNYQIERNDNREENNKLLLKYLLDEDDIKQILLSLNINNFSSIKKNYHENYRYESLYVFGKKIKLLLRTLNKEKEITLYIKINKRKDGYVVIVSIHEAKYPINYYFKEGIRNEKIRLLY